MKFRIISGDISKRSILIPWLTCTKLNWGLRKGDTMTLTGQLELLEIANQDNTRHLGKTAAGAVVGAALAGPLGAIAGGVLSGKSQSLIVIGTLTDGRKFIAEVDQQAYKLLLTCVQA